MTPFEYVSVLISIVLGIGITQIVSGVADVIQNWRGTKLYLPHALWVLFVFFLHIQEWWLLYEMRLLSVWKLPVFLFTILYPVGLFVMARLLFPAQATAESVSFKDHYYANFPKFFVMALILISLSLLDNVLLNDYKIKDQPVQLFLLGVLSLLIYKKPKQPWVHLTLAIILLLFLLGSMAVAGWTIEA